MMHLMESEWAVLIHSLQRPELIQAMLPLENKVEVDALCEDIRESMEFNHSNALEWKIMDAAINNSELHKDLPTMDLPYHLGLEMVDAAYSLQDRFAARFPVPPNKWMDLLGSKTVDVKDKRH